MSIIKMIIKIFIGFKILALQDQIKDENVWLYRGSVVFLIIFVYYFYFTYLLIFEYLFINHFNFDNFMYHAKSVIVI
jgi:hypothetical protein